MFTPGSTIVSKQREVEFDQGRHYRARLGFILMSTDLAAEADFFDMAPEGVAVHITRLKTDDYTTTETLARHADRFARSLAVVIDVLDPHVVVLGGGVSNLPGLVPRIEARWGRYVFDSSGRGEVRTRLVTAKHGDSSGVRGAAWLWPRGT